MVNLDYAKCPICPNEAHGKREVERLFGYRNDAGRIKVQSYCRSCRIEHKRKMRLINKKK